MKDELNKLIKELEECRTKFSEIRGKITELQTQDNKDIIDKINNDGIFPSFIKINYGNNNIGYVEIDFPIKKDSSFKYSSSGIIIEKGDNDDYEHFEITNGIFSFDNMSNIELSSEEEFKAIVNKIKSLLGNE